MIAQLINFPPTQELLERQWRAGFVAGLGWGLLLGLVILVVSLRSSR